LNLNERVHGFKSREIALENAPAGLALVDVKDIDMDRARLLGIAMGERRKKSDTKKSDKQFPDQSVLSISSL
jgi:ribosomal protein L13E